tara:strand:- start:2790 stop:3245 length:456 start_codon:yes stop_codon:yes gene_type:complete
MWEKQRLSCAGQFVKVHKLESQARVPTKAHMTDAGWDLYTVEDKHIPSQSRETIATGMSIEIPDGFVGLIWPRSSLAIKHGIDVFAGVIDSGYRGEIKVCLFNSSNDGVDIVTGDRIAQILFQPAPSFFLKETDALTSTDRGEGGFGSSGK